MNKREREHWEIYDTRDGRRATVNDYPSKRFATWQIEAWSELGTQGRHELKEKIPYLDARPRTVAGDA